jgi:hypothetical protein
MEVTIISHSFDYLNRNLTFCHTKPNLGMQGDSMRNSEESHPSSVLFIDISKRLNNYCASMV